MLTNFALVIAAIFAFANGMHIFNDSALHPKSGKNRLAGWNFSGGKCNFVRPQIKTFGYCWMDENEAKGINTQKERRWVKEVIQQWEKCGGIKFVEEPKCRRGPDFVTINVGNYHPKVKPDYETDPCKINGFDMLLDFYTFGKNIESWTVSEKIREAVIKMYSLHEFGHFIGFDHEHNRDDKTSDCEQAVDGPMVGPNAVWGTYHITKEYDPNSIMNYCRKNGHYKPNLSPLDKQGVRDAYGGGNQQECDAVTKPLRWGPGEGLAENTLKELDMEAKGITCFDLADSEYCKDMSCDAEVTTQIYCRKRCGTCSGGDQPVETTTQEPATSAPAGCADRESAKNCNDWKGLCSKDSTKFWCAKTCGAC